MTGRSSDTRIVLAAGGTGGHMFPAYAVAEALRGRGYKPVLATDERGARYAGPFGDMEQHQLPAANVARSRLTGVINLIRATLSAFRLFGIMKPALVMGFGGYAALPALLAARLRGVPRCVHEQNAVLGRVNRAIGGSVQRIALSFEETRLLKPSLADRTVVTGNPVRDEVTALYATPYLAPEDDGDVRILVLGGSQGAKILSDVIPDAIVALPKGLRARIHVTQQCRPETLDAVRATYEKSGVKHNLAAFFGDMAEQLVNTHLVIARAGASTISELEVAGRPSILVPLRIAMDDHQTANAAGLAAAGGAWVFPEDDFSAPVLSEKLTSLLNDSDALARASHAARSLARPDAAERLADMVEGLLDGRAVKAIQPTKGGDGAGVSARMSVEGA